VAAHTLVASQLIPRRLDDILAFFARPENLGRLPDGATLAVD